MCKSRDLKGDKIARYLLKFPTIRMYGERLQTWPLSLSLGSPRKNNVRLTISASKNLNYRPHRQSGQ